MSKRKTRSYHGPQTTLRRTAQKPSHTQLKRDAKDAQKFFVVLTLLTVLLVIFLYYIFVGRG